jgi:hypothetical protein
MDITMTTKDVYTPNTDLSEDEKFALEQVSDAFIVLHKELDDTLTDGRYKSLAYTSLETAAMWASKSITKDGLL